MPGDNRGRLSRRRLLQGGAVLAGGATLGAVAARATTQADTSGAAAASGAATVPFRGRHQAGITTPAQAHAWFVGLDLREGADTDALARLLRLWTDDAERLATGVAPLADQERELARVPARLTVTAALGPPVLARLGLPRPDGLAPVPALDIDRLEPTYAQTDLLLQVCSDDPLTLAHAMRVLTRDARPFASTRWVQRGFGRARGSVPDGTTARNLLGQVDGTVQPSAEALERAVWIDTGPWAGGTSLVLRRIRFDRDHWEQIGRSDRELVIGRRLSDGSPITGGDERTAVDLEAADGGLSVVPEFAHVRQARARSTDELMLRRGYTYDDSPSRDGSDDAGLLFAAYVADVTKQFLPVQLRLATLDLLNRWTIPVGSAVYGVLPGASDGDWLGRTVVDPASR